MSRGYQFTRVITPASSQGLVSLDQAKAALGIALDDTSQDDALTLQINQVSADISSYCDRIFVRQVYRDQFRFSYNSYCVSDPLVTRQYPIIINDLTTLVVTEDGVVVDDTLVEVVPDTGSIYRLDANGSYAWTGNLVLIDYTAGFDPIPADLQGATLTWLTSRQGFGGRDPALTSETIPDLIAQSYDVSSTSSSSGSTGTSAIPAAVLDTLVRYRMWTL